MLDNDPTPDDADDQAAAEAKAERRQVDHEAARSWLCAVTELLGMARECERSPGTVAAVDLFLRTACQRASRVLRSDILD